VLLVLSQLQMLSEFSSVKVIKSDNQNKIWNYKSEIDNPKPSRRRARRSQSAI